MKVNYEKIVFESNYKLLYGILCKQMEQLNWKYSVLVSPYSELFHETSIVYEYYTIK